MQVGGGGKSVPRAPVHLSSFNQSSHFQQYFSYIVAVSFIGGGIQRTRRKSLSCRNVTDKLYQKMLYTSLWSRLELATSEVIGTDCIGSYKTTIYDHGHDDLFYFFKINTGCMHVSFSKRYFYLDKKQVLVFYYFW